MGFDDCEKCWDTPCHCGYQDIVKCEQQVISNIFILLNVLRKMDVNFETIKSELLKSKDERSHEIAKMVKNFDYKLPR